MNKASRILLKSIFKDKGLVDSSIKSFEWFVDEGMQQIVDQVGTIEPTIIPPNVEELKVVLGEVRIGKPITIEAEGSERLLYPSEARIRNLTYAAPIFLTFKTYVDGKLTETVERNIGMLPIMLRSKYCLLRGLSKDELIEKGEDPYDPGGYFIINGTERVLVAVEDLAPNHFTVQSTSTGPSKYVGKIFSTFGSYRIPTTLEQLNDGIVYVSFSRANRIPFVLLLKALGMTNDQEIMESISRGYDFPELVANLYEAVEVKDSEEAMDKISKLIGINQSREVRLERTANLIDNLFLPHVGRDEKYRLMKAHNLCRLVRSFLLVSHGYLPEDDKDHYKNKRLKLAGELLADLFQSSLTTLINDVLYNFQRIVKRGKFPSFSVVVRNQLLTSRIYSAMATGNWVGGRTGISQRMMRLNYLESLSHLQRVVSPLSSSEENFAARELHGTHFGRLCPVETPEGTNIGLKKNLAIFAKISESSDEASVLSSLSNIGLKRIDG
ncbi:MAG: DNA-directed polymerase subunit [Candidatus Woesearchaeota archaeon]|nr:DNA-directed polymerase subunit [Candidatus Woesearchaeota archaeon]MDN5328019.1 DNA-directed polymerase subunit [Candidatus Woesearchaeota archaeon]